MHKFNVILQPFSLLQLVVKDILQTDFEVQLQTPRQIAALVKVRHNRLCKRVTTATFDPVGCLRVTGLIIINEPLVVDRSEGWGTAAVDGARPSAMVVEKDVVGPSAMVVESDGVGPSPMITEVGRYASQHL